MKRVLAVFLVFCSLTLPAASAQEPQDVEAKETENQLQADELATEDWRDELGVFRVGIVSGGDIEETVARSEPFRLALAEALNMRVELFPARDFSALIDAASDSRIEYTVFSASAYALAWSFCECIEPLVVARSGDGTSDYRQILIARDQAAGPDALIGKRIGVIETGNAGGIQLAMRELREAGVDLDAGDAELVGFANGEAALEALAQGETDAVLGWSSMQGDKTQGYSRGTLHRIARRGGTAPDYKVVWQSTPIPHRTHAIRKNLPAQAKTILRSKLVTMFDSDPVAYDSIEPVFGGGFVSARQSGYEALIGLMRSKGVKAAQ